MSQKAWSKADLHIHSNHSDGLATIPQIMDHVQDRTDLRIIAITDHNTIEGARFAQSLQDMYDFEVVVGEEISSKHGHIIGLWLEEAIPPGLSAMKTLSEIGEQGGVAVIPHPFSSQGVFGPFGKEILGRLEDVAFHALEVYNSLPYLSIANRIASRALTGGQGVAPTGGSDAHVLRAVGSGYTLFRGDTSEDLRSSIDRLETRAEAQRGGLSLAVRYVLGYPMIRRRQAWNWERCKV